MPPTLPASTQVATVVGHAREQVIPLVEADTQVVVQEVQNGTAGAVLACADAFAGFDGSLSVLTGDCPLIKPETIARLAQVRDENNAAVVVLTMKLDDPTGYGRIVRDADGQVERIVEQKDATPEEAAVNECNSGFYCFDARALFDALAPGETTTTPRASSTSPTCSSHLPRRRASRAGARHRRRRRVPGRQLPRPAGPGHQGHAAPHQRTRIWPPASPWSIPTRCGSARTWRSPRTWSCCPSVMLMGAHRDRRG